MLHYLVAYWPVTVIVGGIVLYVFIWIGGSIRGAKKILGDD